MTEQWLKCPKQVFINNLTNRWQGRPVIDPLRRSPLAISNIVGAEEVWGGLRLCGDLRAGNKEHHPKQIPFPTGTPGVAGWCGSRGHCGERLHSVQCAGQAPPHTQRGEVCVRCPDHWVCGAPSLGWRHTATPLKRPRPSGGSRSPPQPLTWPPCWARRHGRPRALALDVWHCAPPGSPHHRSWRTATQPAPASSDVTPSATAIGAAPWSPRSKGRGGWRRGLSPSHCGDCRHWTPVPSAAKDPGKGLTIMSQNLKRSPRSPAAVTLCGCKGWGFYFIFNYDIYISLTALNIFR